MTFIKFMELYDDWNGKIKINDNTLNCIVRCHTNDLMWKDGKYYKLLEKIADKSVQAFGFDNNIIYVRINCKKEDVI